MKSTRVALSTLLLVASCATCQAMAAEKASGRDSATASTNISGNDSDAVPSNARARHARNGFHKATAVKKPVSDISYTQQSFSDQAYAGSAASLPEASAARSGVQQAAYTPRSFNVGAPFSDVASDSGNASQPGSQNAAASEASQLSRNGTAQPGLLTLALIALGVLGLSSRKSGPEKFTL
jgi:hypothetical protein